jgi:adenylate kinase family enzyme
MKNKIILVAGFPAAGKSTFSRRLSKHLNIPCFNKDVVKEVMADGFGIENVDFINRDKKGSAATFMLMLHIAEQFLQTGNVCILESNFQKHYPLPITESGQIENLLIKYNCECLTFVFKGELDVVSERYFNRNRHWVHERAKDRESIKNYCIATKLGEFGIGKIITVDTTSFENVDYDGLIKIAEKFVNDEIIDSENCRSIS